MKIVIEVIEHKKQRYPTCGDWYYDANGDMQIRISKLKSGEKNEMLLAIHELVEALACRYDGVSQEAVDKFDFWFEEEIADRKTPYGDEPGDHPQAPYRKQHCLATGIERILTQQWGGDWFEKEDELYKLPYPHYLRAPKKL